jgi:hypothetical protein
LKRKTRKRSKKGSGNDVRRGFICVDIKNKEVETLKDLDKYQKTIGRVEEAQIKDDGI